MGNEINKKILVIIILAFITSLIFAVIISGVIISWKTQFYEEIIKELLVKIP